MFGRAEEVDDLGAQGVESPGEFLVDVGNVVDGYSQNQDTDNGQQDAGEAVFVQHDEIIT